MLNVEQFVGIKVSYYKMHHFNTTPYPCIHLFENAKCIESGFWNDIIHCMCCAFSKEHPLYSQLIYMICIFTCNIK